MSAEETPPDPGGGQQDTRPRRSGVSVRTRLTVTMAVLASLALVTAGVIIWTVETDRREVAAVNDASQETAELRTFAEKRVDPATGQPFTAALPLLREFLASNVPGPNEILVAWVGDGVALYSRTDHSAVLTEPDFEAAVRSHLTAGGRTRVQSTEGELLLTVQPVAAQEGGAALVVVTLLDKERASLNELLRTYLVVAVLAMLLVTGLAAWQGRRLLSPLRELSETAREISSTDLSRRVPETGNDDITALTRTVNSMLARLETAFTGQRQFLDDAGHELRTPLTILAGHLELMDAGDPVEVEQTRALLLEEVERMSRLVDDLILLAKSRRPDFLSPAPVDLDDLTHTILAKARVMADRDWQQDDVTSALVHVDEQRITQAVLQLVDNAVKHTDPGDTIAIGSSVDGDTARVWVRDTGDGIPETDRTLVLERFARSTVRSDDGGFGLGLSIVTAIAVAHGGSLTLAETRGGGTTATVEFAVEATWPTS